MAKLTKKKKSDPPTKKVPHIKKAKTTTKLKKLLEYTKKSLKFLLSIS